MDCPALSRIYPQYKMSIDHQTGDFQTLDAAVSLR
jgi:hypothetical protein